MGLVGKAPLVVMLPEVAAWLMISTIVKPSGARVRVFCTRSTTVPASYSRSPPLPLDVTTERFGFFNPLALDQVVIRLLHLAGTAVYQPEGK
jgi:hypothetical protein